MSGFLTTHVLDTANGLPAAALEIELARLTESGERSVIKTVRTNGDGRTDEPLLSQTEFETGVYEIVFSVGGYFAGISGSSGTPDLPEPPFLDRVPVRFGIADAEAHYHVPLLASPYSYSTYRGS
ncbi:hydroxyisourate hydrolase [Rubrobacter aplysinae]|uniref:hydroxyisourate hydrolase n=1 Tax=Rubrobacter aplysinae TaxID=909625 RepID=UPI00064BD233|nr:hydroxyisourate hydrolase [Rubrobacter aplysinae]